MARTKLPRPQFPVEKMAVRSLHLPQRIWVWLHRESKRSGFPSRSAYVRALLDDFIAIGEPVAAGERED
jgi:hypothetical protein